MLVKFCPPEGSSLENLVGVYYVKEGSETDRRLTLEVELEGHTTRNPSLVYISAVREHCQVVEE